MKQTIIRIGSILLIASLLFSACKKTDTSTTASAITENGSLSGKNVTPVANLSEEPTGILEVTEDQFNALNNGQVLEVAKTAPHTYIAIKPIPWPQEPEPPIDPCAQDWIDLANYMNATHAAMQAWANAHCKPATDCWVGRCGAYSFQVNPNIYCGDPVRFERFLRVFE